MVVILSAPGDTPGTCFCQVYRRAIVRPFSVREKSTMAALRFEWLVVSLSPRSPGFNFRPVLLQFVVRTVALKKVSLQVLLFPLLVLLPYRSTILHWSITGAAHSQKFTASLCKAPNKKITRILADTYDMKVDTPNIYTVSRNVYISWKFLSRTENEPLMCSTKF